MSFLDNHVNNNLSNVTSIGRVFIQNLAKAVCAKTDLGNLTSSGNSVIQTQAANTCIKKDLSNLTAAQKHAIVDLCMPSGTNVEMTPPTTTGATFVAGSTGFVVMVGFATSTSSWLSINAGGMGQFTSCNVTGRGYYLCIPIIRGQTVNLQFNDVKASSSYGAAAHPGTLRFVQAGGG